MDVLLMRNDEDIATTVYRKENNLYVYLHQDFFSPVSWIRGTLKPLVERAYLICSTPNYWQKELIHIRTVFRNTNDCPHWIINQIFEQIKVKQRDPVPNSNGSNENQATVKPVAKQQLKNMMIKCNDVMI